MANQIRGVLYLERDKFQLSIDSRADVLTYVFPPTLVSNLDILDLDQFKQNLTEFIKKNNVVLNSLIIVLSSSVIFEKDFKTEEEPQVQDFLDNVPYETISINKIPIPGGTKVLVGNATFYTLLADVFKQNQVQLDFVIPERALGANIGAFNASTARLILSQFEALSKFKSVVDESTQSTVDFKPPEKKQVVVHKKNYTLLYTIPVFVLLFLVLGFMLLQPVIFKKKSSTKLIASEIPTIMPRATVEPTPAAQPTGTTFKKATTALINVDPTSTAKVDQLKSILGGLGVSTIQSTTVASTIAVPVVLISTTVDPTEKQKILDEIKKVFPSISAQDSPNATTDIVITIGKTQ